jgi:hypothetical protein
MRAPLMRQTARPLTMLRWHVRTEDGAPASPLEQAVFRCAGARGHENSGIHGRSVGRIEEAYELFANQRYGKVAIFAQ